MRRKYLVVLAVLALSPGGSRNAASQQRELMDLFGNLVRTGAALAAQQAWKQLPPNELSCVDQALRQSGSSVAQSIQYGITPSDARVSDARAACRMQAGPAPNITTNSGPAVVTASSIYNVDGLALGSRAPLGSASYAEYSCVPSNQFVGFTWCQRKKNERTARGAFVSNYSLLHAADGTVVYVNRFLEPAWFSGSEANEDIGRLSKKFGAAPTQTIALPPNRSGQNGVIALWGDVKLLPLDPQSLAQVAAGTDTRAGILVDHLGNFRRSAELNLPVYRLAGGAGFVWAGNWDQGGTGTLRFFASDLTSTTNQVVAGAPKTDLREPQPSRPRLSGLIETPAACIQLQNAEFQPGNPAQTCPLVAECRFQLNERAAAVDAYLKQSPEVSSWLRDQKTSSPVQTPIRDFGGALLKAQIPQSQNCNYDRQYIQLYWIALRGGANSAARRPFESWQAAGKTFQSDIQNMFAEDERTYNELLKTTDQYPGRDDLTSGFAAYRQLLGDEDYEQALRARAGVLKGFEFGKQRKRLLDDQAMAIKSQSQLVADWANQLSGPLAAVADQATITAVRQLKTDLDSLAERRDRTKADVSADVNQMAARVEEIRPSVAKIAKASQLAKDLSDARASTLNGIPVLTRRFQSLPNPRLLPAETQKIAELDKIASALNAYRPDDSERQAAFQSAIADANATMSALSTAVGQQEGVDSLSADIEKLNAKVSSRGRDLLDNKTSQVIAELVSQQQSFKLMKFPLADEQLRAYSNAKETFQRVASDIDNVLATAEKKREVQRLGDQYVRESGTRWSLDQRMDPMTDKAEYKVSSVQKNEEGAVGEIEGRCAERGVISFTALVVDQDGKPTISFPNYRASEQVLVGKRRFNSDDPQSAVFVSDQFNNRFLILFLVGQAAQPDKSRQGNPVEALQSFSKAMEAAIVGGKKAEDTWRVLVQIDTDRGSLVLKIPTYERNIRKLIDACS